VLVANNTGKSNVIDALRMTLLPLTGWPLRPSRDDFTHDGTGEPTGAEMTITAGFEGLNLQQSGRMVTAVDGARDRAALHLSARFLTLVPHVAAFWVGTRSPPTWRTGRARR
jgi:hypothetical protein